MQEKQQMVKVNGTTIIIDNIRATIEDMAEFEKAIGLLDGEGHPVIKIDLSKTVYLPSELLGYLMGKKRAFKSAGRDIRIIAISESLKRIFDEAKISDFLGT
jgi:anti-anti-sigma regulatory factor